MHNIFKYWLAGKFSYGRWNFNPNKCKVMHKDNIYTMNGGARENIEEQMKFDVQVHRSLKVAV